VNITNKYCLIIELTTYQLDKLSDLMPESDLFDHFSTDTIIGFRHDGKAGTFGYSSEDQLISYTEMMQLLGKTMGFTKSDLLELAKTETVFIKRRDGEYRVYIGGIFSGNGWVHPASYGERLNHIGQSPFDIMSVYVANRHEALIEQLKGIGLTEVWERTEQTPAQKEMEVLQVKMNELQAQMKVVQAKL
jgi:hypothetical protein